MSNSQAPPGIVAPLVGLAEAWEVGGIEHWP